MAGNRRSVWHSGSAATLAIAAFAMPVAGVAAPEPGFAMPSSQLLLTRTLNRTLPDGQSIITRRSYSVRFVPDGVGYRVEGRLVETRVDAPPALTAFAELERQRSDAGLFPIYLDARGWILGVGKGRRAKAAYGPVTGFAAAAIDNSNMPAADRQEARAIVNHLGSSGQVTPWPADVFHPSPGKRSETRTIALPGGAEGHVTIEIEASGATPGGQLATLDRVVTTEMAGDSRITREHWQLSRNLYVIER